MELKKLESNIYHSKFIPGTFWGGNFEKNMGQEKQESKIYHPRFILTSAGPGQVRKTGFTGLLDVGYVVYHRHKQEISGE